MKRPMLTFLLVCGVNTLLLAQDLDPYFGPRAAMLLDPSRTGFDPGAQVSLIHFDQWLQEPGTWNSDLLAAEWCARNRKKVTASWLGIGCAAMRDRTGATGGQVTSLSVLPAMHLRASRRSYLSSGLEVRLVHGAYNNDEGAWASQYDGTRYDASLASGENRTAGNSKWLEARAGLSWTMKQDAESARRRERNAVVLGVAADHLGQLVLPESGITAPTVPMRFTAYALVEQPHEIWENGYFSADVIGQVQGPFRTARLNVHAGKHLLNAARREGGPALIGFRAGVGYRLQDALLVDAGIDLSKLSFGLAYGWSVINRDGMAAGKRTVEVILQVRLGG